VDGVFLSALLPPLKELILSRKCRKIGRSARDAFGLLFDDGVLILNARPDSPGLIWSKAVNMTELSSPAWNHHLDGAEVRNILQPGADRILHIRFSSTLLYGNSDVTLIFEATGRNANVILVRDENNRILSCHRKVPSTRSRYRTVAPGQLYVPPPSSGLSPGSWSHSIELKRSIEDSKNSPAILYKTLEGVGPVTARALMRDTEINETSLLKTVSKLETALLEKNFNPWFGPDGPLPIELGTGKPIENPLSMKITGEPGGIREDRLETWSAILRRRLSFLYKRLDSLKAALDGLVSPDKYRTWGNLLLSTENNSKKGLEEIVLKDWNGFEHTIKASNTGIERRNLEEHEQNTLAEIESLEKSLSRAPNLPVDELDDLLRNHRKKERKKEEQRKTIGARTLSGGWRCFSGRNARENDEVTFKIGKRGDYWFHARGIPGAQVILKLDGRTDNPPEDIILETAIEAAKGSGVFSGIIPVDYTRVQYVNRMRKGKPGQVVYSREKTIFVDLDRLS
jgi:predicted ribosome quality control (RQC) complex YloA/Tae2 family protein